MSEAIQQQNLQIAKTKSYRWQWGPGEIHTTDLGRDYDRAVRLQAAGEQVTPNPKQSWIKYPNC